MEEENQGVSFGRVCKVAFHRWKLLLIITAVITVAGFFGIYYGYNYGFNVYSMTFSYSGSGLAKEQKADNTTFAYKSLISKETLEDVKSSNPSYADIDVDKLLKENAFVITRSVEVINNENEYSYKLSIKRNKMPSLDIAKSFFADIASYPLKEDADYITTSSFDSALQRMSAVETFEEQIDLLTTQADALKDSYDVIKELNISRALSDEIASNIYSIESTIDKEKANLLNQMVINYGLAPDYKSLDDSHLEQQKTALTVEKDNNTVLIAALTDQIKELGTSAAVSTLGSEMTQLIVRNNTIDQEVEKIDKKVANKGKETADVPGHNDFMKDMNKIVAELKEEITDFKSVMTKAYVSSAKVNYENSNVITVEKSMNIVVSILLPLVAGLAVGIITNLIIDRKMLHEEEAK